MIQGFYLAGRPQISGLLMFPSLSGLTNLPVSFVVDSGADRSLLTPNDYEDYFEYVSTARYPVSDSSGFGSQIQAHLVPARLTFRHTDGQHTSHSLIIEVLRPQVPAPYTPLPSVLGRDILDQFRFVCDRTAGLVQLEDCADPAAMGQWPDEDNATRVMRQWSEKRLEFDGLTMDEALNALQDPATYPGCL